MKIYDTLQLVKNEYQYGRWEWILNIVLQVLIFSCTFFVISLVTDLGGMGEEYLHKLYPDGYEFSLTGYTEEDTDELESMGFRNLGLGEDGGMGTRDTIRGIWRIKIKAILAGKDIWNPDLDEFITMLGCFQIIFGMTALLLIVVTVNHLSHSFSIKLISRKRYIQMLFRLGCRQKEIRRIYRIFFSVGTLVSLLVSCVINTILIWGLNRYVNDVLGIWNGMRAVRILEGAGLLLVIELMLGLACRKIWGEYDDRKR